MTRTVLGIDLGTSGVKCLLLNEKGEVLAQATESYPLYQPQNGWAEQEPLEWYAAVERGIKACLRASGQAAEAVKAIGLSGQMHGLVMLDEQGHPLRPSIIWCDQRTGKECEEIEERIGRARLIDITCNPALTGFTLSKILWVRKHEPEIYARCRHILLPKDYIRYRLTGSFATDASDASGMQLLDVGKRDWSRELMDAFGLEPSLFAKVLESPEISGHITKEAARATGLVPGTPVAAGAGDNAAAAVGSGVVREGSAFCTIGTSGVVYAHTEALRLDPAGRVHSFCCAVPGKWHVMGVTQGAGLSMQWMRNTLYPEDAEYESINRDIASLPIGAERLVYLPYLMGERTPHLDPDCRGAFVGLSAIHERKHMARAVMEGVSYSLKDCLDVLQGMGVQPREMILCGGGSKSPLWRQMLADVFEMDAKTLAMTDNAALGAGILAMVAAGIHADVESACDSIISASESLAPDASRAARYRAVHNVYKGLYPALRQSFKELCSL